ncbi:haloacid dehalogenase-like hydrolase domain-containing protein 2 [Ornithodoros turicata]|uniref:Haloacid dehalogenase-like hydrolase domain-containing protein 2 n=1 Tax=Ornithodoros turicata TaxID=34597 RepID=A0A2R5LJ15_9ACAR
MALRRPIKAVLLDLSGTLHIEDTVVKDAVRAVQRLREANIKIHFITNTTKEPRHFLHKRLRKMGFHLTEDDITSSLTAAKSYLQARNLRPLLMVSDAAMEEFQDIDTNNPNAVVVGLAPKKFDFNPMNEAFRLLLDKAQLIAIHKARYYRTKTGLALGPGPFVTALEYATDKVAKVVGKPEKSFFVEVLKRIKCDPEETVMVGDDVRDDIDGAQKVGMRGILVMTGKYMYLDELKISPRPWATASSVLEAVDMILNEDKQPKSTVPLP